VIYVGLDDTDIVGSPGTNQLARSILKQLGTAAEGAVICRHQLFFDRRVPYTSKNGSASIVLPRAASADRDALVDRVRPVMRAWFIEGSDPGLCVAKAVPEAVQDFGRRCQREILTQDEAHALAIHMSVHLEGLGGTEQGVIGALAAVGLAATGEDGRVIQLTTWPYPDEFAGPQDVAAIRARGVEEIRRTDSGALITTGVVDIGKHLRPNVRHGRIVLFVAPAVDAGTSAAWQAVKLT
jgi:tRNA(Ile2) C34 agmatinyltransferase TiaS